MPVLFQNDEHQRQCHPNAEPVPDFIRPYANMPSPPRPTERRVEQASTKPRKIKNGSTEGRQWPMGGRRRESPARAAPRSIEFNLEGPLGGGPSQATGGRRRVLPSSRSIELDLEEGPPGGG
jgi:hypothetical protein